MEKISISLILVMAVLLNSCGGDDNSCPDDNRFCHFHDGLNWSDPASYGMNWDVARLYCKDMGGRLPTISELRTLVQNCPRSEYPKPEEMNIINWCAVTDMCLGTTNCNRKCKGCSSDTPPEGFSVFGHTDWFWSSSFPLPVPYNIWGVSFDNGSVSTQAKEISTYGGKVICVESPSESCVRRDVRNCIDFVSFERCIDGKKWEKISLEHEGLKWSCKASDIMKFREADEYCKNIGGRLPIINELRTLVNNCSRTEYPRPDGIEDWCKVEDPDNLKWDRDYAEDCWVNIPDDCLSYFDDFGDFGIFLSSSSSSTDPDHYQSYWEVDFDAGRVSQSGSSADLNVRCVK